MSMSQKTLLSHFESQKKLNTKAEISIYGMLSSKIANNVFMFTRGFWK